MAQELNPIGISIITSFMAIVSLIWTLGFPIICGTIIALIAGMVKGRNAFIWFLYGLVFSFVFPIPLAHSLCLPTVGTERYKEWREFIETRDNVKFDRFVEKQSSDYVSEVK